MRYYNLLIANKPFFFDISILKKFSNLLEFSETRALASHTCGLSTHAHRPIDSRTLRFLMSTRGANRSTYHSRIWRKKVVSRPQYSPRMEARSMFCGAPRTI